MSPHQLLPFKSGWHNFYKNTNTICEHGLKHHHSVTTDLRHIILQFNYYRPQRSWGKVMFSQACVILFTGGSASVLAGIHTPPGADTHPPGADTPGSRHPPGADTHPPGADTPGSRHPPWSRHPPEQTPQEQTHTPPSMQGDTVNARASYWNAILFVFFCPTETDSYYTYQILNFFQAKSTRSTGRERRLLYQFLHRTDYSSTMHSNVGILRTDNSILVLFLGPGIHRPAYTQSPNSKGSCTLNANECQGLLATSKAYWKVANLTKHKQVVSVIYSL